ncbi:hypothetical protein [Dactylosporangium sp. NPDC051484]|uniref:hypothetical protein n=1 Tax=Dactylosporangium sp. NPDC051484 TaxID=3154942 RepID=UPI00344F5716
MGAAAETFTDVEHNTAGPIAMSRAISSSSPSPARPSIDAVLGIATPARHDADPLAALDKQFAVAAPTGPAPTTSRSGGVSAPTGSALGGRKGYDERHCVASSRHGAGEHCLR